MLFQYAFIYFDLGASLKILEDMGEQAPLLTSPSEELRQRISETLNNVVPRIRAGLLSLDLSLSVVELDRWTKSIDDLKRVSNLSQRITDELASRSFLYVKPEKSEHYTDFRNGWTDALAQFNIATDVEEAEKCFALERYSGCVYHLMRVCEIGVQELGKYLKLAPVTIQDSWGVIVKAVQGEVPKMLHSTQAEKMKQSQVANAADALWQVNLAWRIPAEHPRTPGDSYTEEQAADALSRVKALMRTLVSVVT